MFLKWIENANIGFFCFESVLLYRSAYLTGEVAFELRQSVFKTCPDFDDYCYYASYTAGNGASELADKATPF